MRLRRAQHRLHASARATYRSDSHAGQGIRIEGFAIVVWRVQFILNPISIAVIAVSVAARVDVNGEGLLPKVFKKLDDGEITVTAAQPTVPEREMAMA